MDTTRKIERPLYISFENVVYRKNTKTFVRYRELSDEPGPAHALDVKSTHEGDPWRRYGRGPRSAHKRPHFYDHDGPRAACGVRVKVALPMEVDAEDPDVCAECAELVREGKAVGRGRSAFETYRYERRCTSFLRVEEDGETVLYQCVERDWHGGRPHRDWSGATWEIGLEDFTPAPDGYV